MNEDRPAYQRREERLYNGTATPLERAIADLRNLLILIVGNLMLLPFGVTLGFFRDIPAGRGYVVFCDRLGFFSRNSVWEAMAQDIRWKRKMGKRPEKRNKQYVVPSGVNLRALPADEREEYRLA